MTVVELLICVLIGIFGIVLGWLLGQQKAKVQLSLADERLKQAAENMEAQKQAFEERKKEMETHFKVLAGDALKANREDFIALANQNFQVAQEKANKELEVRKKAIEGLVKPLGENLDKLEKANKELEKSRQGAYGELKVTLERLQKETKDLIQTSGNLSTALRGSIQDRGRWGQVSLRNIAEAAGMLNHCDFEEEYTLKSGEGGKRPDMVVRFPQGAMIPVDAKAPMAAYLRAHESNDPDVRKEHFKVHAKDLAKHVKTLADRDYSSLIEGELDFTVMFIPSDPILAAAFEHDANLQIQAFEKRVLIATPVTLIALLRTVSIYWQQQSMAENARDICNQAKEVYDRVAIFADHLSKVGSGLKSAVSNYNKAVGSFDRKIVPAGRKLAKMEVTVASSRELNELPLLEIEPDDSWLLSLRNFSSIVKIDRSSGEVVWGLGGVVNDFDITGTPFLHEHQFDLEGDSLLVFDNDGLAGNQSRVVEYDFDEEGRTAEEIWSYVPDPSIYCFVLGDVERMDGDDRLITWSAAGSIERVTQAGEQVWQLTTPLGYVIGFNSLESSLYRDP